MIEKLFSQNINIRTCNDTILYARKILYDIKTATSVNCFTFDIRCNFSIEI